ncbi:MULTISPECIES: hypothetical protein [Mycobacteriaceae]|uniref:ATP/GTP-binding protein n=1 Tax=Mycolicibacterium neoaurum VKM Ac-1815D TaxID=700508 RepID=V5XH39_MYCNE|nr:MULTISPECIES: hypothetical protein [Mycobacteriaceae]AHC26714.1 hypothetical protein D174_20100 [Mycolicibacterium neoaurum VKM Ac-1815D]AMO07026.1 hypothetical protein MyAD_19725 [Mycolicibacterium neoaurum]AXK74597.1 hypothetical protein DXK33_05210 [Mycolicibacterium neoaurum]KJQ48373.1 hypothetical protein TS71_22040 [Mycolicibacterium neoaurum]KUM06587.1 hypothetical protein AVZ31_20375 [Mycolicibacterium neoaurum]
MGRRNRSRRDPDRQPPAVATRRVEVGPDGTDHEVRPVPASRADKTYRCPGCDHEIRPGTAHVVAIPVDDVDDRRHWHTACWANRANRGPTRRWS